LLILLAASVRPGAGLCSGPIPVLAMASYGPRIVARVWRGSCNFEASAFFDSSKLTYRKIYVKIDREMSNPPLNRMIMAFPLQLRLSERLVFYRVF